MSPAPDEVVTLSGQDGDLTFRGRVLATVTSGGNDAKASWYTNLTVWRTTEGRIVAQRTTCRPDRRRTKHAVFSDRPAAMNWLGTGTLSLRLFQALGWSV